MNSEPFRRHPIWRLIHTLSSSPIVTHARWILRLISPIARASVATLVPRYTKLSHGLQGPPVHVITVTRSSPSPSSNPRFLNSCRRFARRSVSCCSVFATTASSNGTHALSCPILSAKWFARLLSDSIVTWQFGQSTNPNFAPFMHCEKPRRLTVS